MNREQLVHSFLDGQIGRRVFLRRLVAAGVTLAAASAYADLLTSEPAGASVNYDYYIRFDDSSWVVPATTVGLGKVLEWGNGGSRAHSVQSKGAFKYFNSGPIPSMGAFDLAFPLAATYLYHDKVGVPPIPTPGKVHVPVVVTPANGPLGTVFRVIWTSGSPPLRYHYDVQVRPPGAGYTDWLVDTSMLNNDYQPDAKGAWRFRARVRDTGAAGVPMSDWSPSAKIKVT